MYNNEGTITAPMRSRSGRPRWITSCGPGRGGALSVCAALQTTSSVRPCVVYVASRLVCVQTFCCPGFRGLPCASQREVQIPMSAVCAVLLLLPHLLLLLHL